MSYQAVPSGNEDNESLSSKERSSEDALYLKQYRKPASRRWEWLLILLSGALNLVLTYFLIVSKPCHQCESSEFAGLVPELSLPWVESTEFSSHDILKSNEHWESISFDAGIVALDKKYAESKGLPPSQPFPWDVSKGLYLLNGFHDLHCTKSIHTSLMEFKFSKPQTYPFEHIMHCIDALRLEVLCKADDTPRYSTNDHSNNNGIGQHRQCRDWNKLESWAEENNACYKYLNYSFNDVYDQRQRFVFCPPESPYIAKVEKYLEHQKGL